MTISPNVSASAILLLPPLTGIIPGMLKLICITRLGSGAEIMPVQITASMVILAESTSRWDSAAVQSSHCYETYVPVDYDGRKLKITYFV